MLCFRETRKFRVVTYVVANEYHTTMSFAHLGESIQSNLIGSDQPTKSDGTLGCGTTAGSDGTLGCGTTAGSDGGILFFYLSAN